MPVPIALCRNPTIGKPPHCNNSRCGGRHTPCSETNKCPACRLEIGRTDQAYGYVAIRNHGHYQGEVHESSHPYYLPDSSCTLDRCYTSEKQDTTAVAVVGDVLQSKHSSCTSRIIAIHEHDMAELECIDLPYHDSLRSNFENKVFCDLRKLAQGKSNWRKVDPEAKPAFRRLKYNDVIHSRPCTVTIHLISKDEAVGWCSHCHADHSIDLPRYNRGEGPWRVQLSSNTPPSTRFRVGDTVTHPDLECKTIHRVVRITKSEVTAVVYCTCPMEHNYHIALCNDNHGWEIVPFSADSYSYEVTNVEKVHTLCDQCLPGERLPQPLTCNSCAMKHSCNHDNSMCNSFTPICPRCKIVLNGSGYRSVLPFYNGGDWIHECGQCRHSLFSNTAPSDNQLTLEEEDMKTYSIAKLKQHLQDYLEAVESYDNVVKAWNEHQESTHLDKVKHYLETGEFPINGNNDIDHSDLTLSQRLDHLGAGSNVFHVRTVTKKYDTTIPSERLVHLGALDGDTVDMDNVEASQYLRFATETNDVREDIDKYTLDQE